MIRVLHVVASMNRGGLETFLMNIYRNIDRTKVQFDFLVHTTKKCSYDEEIKTLGGKIYSVPPRNEGVFKNSKALDSFFKTHSEYKVVHQHVSSLSYVKPLWIAKKNGIPIRVIHGHNTKYSGNDLHKYIHKWNQNFVKSFATDFFACSNLAAKWLFPKKQFEGKVYSVINNGIDAEKFIYNEEIRNCYRKELKIEDKFVIGHIGRFHPQKNHLFLIDIFKEIHKRDNNSALLLIGDGVLTDQIKKKVCDYGLSENVIFTSVRSDVPELFQAMDSFVFPSLYEGLGIVLVEAQASGLKCYTSEKVVPKDVDVTGLVKFLDLNQGPNKWADDIISNREYTRGGTVESIKKFGYDIYQVVEDIQKWYEKKVKEI